MIVKMYKIFNNFLTGIYIWSQGRDLYNIVKSVTFDLRFELYPELECILSKHLPDFIHLLEIPVYKITNKIYILKICLSHK